eukprot:m.41296 g.41296  ORF g.41296 m.41296 type:complete len:453 (+) comp33125_c0_seq1:95-1453(+)
MLAFLLCLFTTSFVLSQDVEPSIYSDLSGKVHFSAPNGICFDMGDDTNKSAVSGLKGDKGDAGSDGRDGRDGQASDCTCNCASSGSSECSGSSAALTYPLFKSDGPTWTNLDRYNKVSPNGGTTMGLVTFGLDRYYHIDVASQYIVRFENEDGDMLYTDYSNIRRVKNTADLNILCALPSAKSWPLAKRKATVTAWFRNVAEIEFSGKPGDDQIEFVSNWFRFEFVSVTTDVIISGTGLDVDDGLTAVFRWSNGTTLSVTAKPISDAEINYDLSPYSDRFRGNHTVQLTISSSTLGTLPFTGDVGGDTVVLQGDAETTHPNCTNYHLLEQGWRTVSTTSSSIQYCDQAQRGTGLKAYDWNRFDESIGGQMLSSCPDTTQYYKCSTRFGGWIDDTLPTILGVEFSVKVCFALNKFQCCVFDYQTVIKIVNCGDYYVYYLPYVPACDLAYCSSG